MAASSPAQLLALRDKLTGAIANQKAQTLRQKIQEKSGTVLKSASTVGGGAVGGFAFAKFPKGIMGVDADLALGVAGHLLSAVVGGKHSGTFHAASSGALAGWASRNATLYALANAKPGASTGGPAPRSGAAAMSAREWRQAFAER